MRRVVYVREQEDVTDVILCAPPRPADAVDEDEARFGSENPVGGSSLVSGRVAF